MKTIPLIENAILILLALAFCLISATANTPPTPEGTQVMRHQLAAGQCPNIKPEEAKPALFRIDTTTGRAWVLQAVPLVSPTGTGSVNVWIELHETNSELYRAALTSMGVK
jgi:hypothetical protein